MSKTKFNCDNCNKDFLAYISQRKNKLKFCSVSCKAKYLKGGQFQKGHGFSKEELIKMSESRKKNPINYWKGKKMYAETKLKISRARKGKKLSEETKRKMIGRKAWNKNLIGFMAGEKSHLWKGGITPINAKIRTSLPFKNWRTAVFKRDNWTCYICKQRGRKLEAHHIKSFSDYPDLRFSVENGITLCNECHKKTENYGRKNRFKQK